MTSLVLACLVVSTIPIAIWTYLLLFRGRFWQVRRNLAPPVQSSNPGRRVAIVIPARNEADCIGTTIRSLLEQQFCGQMHIFLVDDASTDGTAVAACGAAKASGCPECLTVVNAGPPPEEWTGKMWAVAEGVARAAASNPDFLLLTDADIFHEPEALSKLVGIAEAIHLDLVSWMVKLETQTLAERALLPAFVFFFLQLYPPLWIAQQSRKNAGAAGGCMLLRPEMLAQAGGIQAIRSELIDDCALARLIKRAGGRICLNLAIESRSTRRYSFREIERMIARTAFNQLRHSPLLLVGTLAALTATYLLPVILTLFADGACCLLGLGTWVMMWIAYRPMMRFYGQSALWGIALPLVALFYAAATVHSASMYWSGRGGTWKGRVQDARPGRSQPSAGS